MFLQLQKIYDGKGFIAALDQSGGSTPKALALYGVLADSYQNDEEMFAQVHAMRSRIIQSPVFSGERILGAILFENTLDRDIAGVPTATFLWEEKGVVPFLKIDKGLAEIENDVQLMKPIPDLDALLEKAKSKGVFGTKMRSVIHRANADAIEQVVAQQFELAEKIIAHGLVPIVEPEVDIHAPDKAQAEALLKTALLAALDKLPENHKVMLKLTLPETADFYQALVEHPKVLRVVALSGGYPRDESNARLAKNHGMIASFSRALTEGLNVNQTDEAFNQTLDKAIESIYNASIT